MHLALVRLAHHLRNAPLPRNTRPHLCLSLPRLTLRLAVRLLAPLLLYQISELLALEELEGSEDGAEHVATQTHREVDLLAVYDSEENEVSMDLIDLAGDFAQNVSHDAQYIIRIYLIHLSQLHQPMIVIYIRAYSFLDRLQLRKNLLGFETRDYLGHLVDGVEEVPLDLEFGVDAEERRGQKGCRVVKLLDVDGWRYLASLDDCGQHTEEITIVDDPDLLEEQISDPLCVVGFLNVSIAYDPLFVRSQT